MSTNSPTRTILVVEDEFLVALDLTESIRDLGYEVISVRVASDAPPPGTYDAALLDHGLSGEASQHLAEILLASHVPFAFCTGLDRNELSARYPSVPTLEKPYLPEGLAAIVHGLFEGRD
jgi:DNA-binding response OmpR family regulator